MTERIGQVAGGPIAVEVLRQGTGWLHEDERRHFPVLNPATVREVCLSSAGRPLLIARTAFTSRRLRDHPTIVRLGNRALGSLLFAGGKPSPYTAREFASLDSGSPLFALVRRRHHGLAEHYWARRTMFRLFGEPLLVTEIFLPELLHRVPAPRGAMPEAVRIGLPLPAAAPPPVPETRAAVR